MLPKGHSKTPEYACWRSIKERCLNPKHAAFKYYGGRGITFSCRWSKFADFLIDIGPRPSKRHSIDRYPDNDGNYEPGNVRWATRFEQQANTRKTRYVIFLDGNRVPLQVACKALGLNLGAVKSRIQDGWSAQSAIETPIGKRGFVTSQQREEIRAMQGISQAAIGRLYGITQAAVSEIKIGRRPRIRYQRLRAKGGVPCG